MADERLIQRLSVLDVAGDPRPAFVEDLHALLADELGFSPRAGRPRQVRTRSRQPTIRLLLVAAIIAIALLGIAVLGSGVFRQRAPAPSQPAIVASTELATRAATPSRAASVPPSFAATPGISPAYGALPGRGMVVVEATGGPAGLPHLEVLQPDGSRRRLLADVAGIQEAPAWSRDGRHLAYAGYDPNVTQRESLWETDASGRTPRQLATSCPPSDCLRDRDPAYSPDGRRLAFVRTHGSNGSATASVVAILDLATGKITEIDSSRMAPSVAQLRGLTWSPDGSDVAFGTVPSVTGDGETFVSAVAVGGGAPRRITTAELEAGDPAWAPDGSTILVGTRPFHTFGPSAPTDMHVYTVAPDGTGATRIGPDGGGAPSWSPDSTHILFTRVTGYETDAVPGTGAARPNLEVMDPSGTTVRPVTDVRSCCSYYWVQQPTS